MLSYASLETTGYRRVTSEELINELFRPEVRMQIPGTITIKQQVLLISEARTTGGSSTSFMAVSGHVKHEIINEST